LTNDQWNFESKRYHWDIGSDLNGSEGQP